MLAKVEIENSQGSVLELKIQDSTNGYRVRDIGGLDPSKANVISSPFALLDGAQYQASRRETRNIIFFIGIDPDYSSTLTALLRANLYKFVMPKSKVTLRFYMEGWPIVFIGGYIESLGSAMFTADPVAVVSILCMNPNFSSVDSTVISGEATHVTRTASEIVSGALAASLPYEGSIETGFIFAMTIPNARDTLTGFSIIRGSNALSFVGNLGEGDLIEISTISGDKYAYVTRKGTTTKVSILYGVSPNSEWIALIPGANDIIVKAAGDPIPWSITYYKRYGGL